MVSASEKFLEFFKERRELFLVVLGIVLLGLGSFGVIFIGNPPYQAMDVAGRVALWASGTILIVIGIVLYVREATPKGAFVIRVYPRHRKTALEFYENAFSSGGDVLILSIMSQSSLKEIEPRLENARKHRTNIQVLTLDPDLSHETIEAIRRHLSENIDDPSETARQVRKAWEHWTAIAEKYRNVEVRKYRSIPTLQGVLVRDKYVTIELLPFDTHPNERPGLVITRSANPEIFDLFQEKYLRLWDLAEGRKGPTPTAKAATS